MKHLMAVLLIASFFVAALSFITRAQERNSSFGYPSVDAARKALTSKPGVRSFDQQGWFIVDDSADRSVWSFTPQDHEAHPAAVKRTLVQKENGDVFVEMNVLCGASKEACDRLVAQFNEMNDNMVRKVRREMQGRSGPK